MNQIFVKMWKRRTLLVDPEGCETVDDIIARIREKEGLLEDTPLVLSCCGECLQGFHSLNRYTWSSKRPCLIHCWGRQKPFPVTLLASLQGPSEMVIQAISLNGEQIAEVNVDPRAIIEHGRSSHLEDLQVKIEESIEADLRAEFLLPDGRPLQHESCTTMADLFCL